MGGNYSQNRNHGLFYVNYNAVSNSNTNIGSRILVFLATHCARFRTPLGEDQPTGHGLVHPTGDGTAVRLQGGIILKRTGNLFETLVSDENLELAIREVNNGHRWHKGHKPNRTVSVVEADIPGHILALRRMIEQGFKPSPAKERMQWDKSAKKWRNICEPKLWPDQYVHHALVQVLRPTMMRGMDDWCCGSIRGRGPHYGKHAIEKWMRSGGKKTRYCLEADIRKFYDTLQPSVVMNRLRQLFKDRRVLALADRILQIGVKAGFYTSQWFANTLLKPLDHAIRKLGPSHYVRYMDNFTVFASSKRKLKKVLDCIQSFLKKNGLEVKGNWQIFKTADRMPAAMGFRYGPGFTLLRKAKVLELKRLVSKIKKRKRTGKRITQKQAAAALSRLGQLQHCARRWFYVKYYPPKLERELKSIIREGSKRYEGAWG